MPRYDYTCEQCKKTIEVIHPIRDCTKKRKCSCGGQLSREVNAPHVEGSLIYPFKLWNIKLPPGKFSVEVRNKAEHQAILKRNKLESPAITKWGTRREQAS